MLVFLLTFEMLLSIVFLSMLCNPEADPGGSIFAGATDMGMVGRGFTDPGIGTAGVGTGAVISDKRLKLLELPETGVPVDCVGVFSIEAVGAATGSFTCDCCC